jgi:lysyl-tRNA synthetase, class II
MPSTLDDLIKTRLDKLAQIKKLGIDPYPAKCNRKQTCAQALEMMGKEVAVAGRIMAIRGHGGIQFFDLNDESGKIQVVFKSDKLKTNDQKLIALLDIGDFIDVQGEVFKTQAGEISILASDFQLLTKSLRPLPSAWYGLKDAEEKYRKRYLDFIFNPEVKQKIKTRSKIVKYIRNFLDQKGFLEVETPVLETDASGAAARPFVTHINAYDIDLYLRICIGELWQKRLLVGGFDKTYEIGRAFRNEGVDFQHNPEFTMLEYYWGYADYEDNMKFHEELFSGLIKDLNGGYKIIYNEQEIDFTPPFKRLSYKDALKEYADLDLEKFSTKELLVSEMKKRGMVIDPKAGRGKLIDDFYKESVRPKLVGPLFLIDHPIDISPLAKKTNDLNYVQRFQLLVLGAEVSNSYSELNDPQDQKERFLKQAELIKAGDEEAMGVDWDYVEAMEYGMPPITGTGIGIDRLTALLTDSHSLREIITFPLMKPENK